jgi:hypothetical protein
MKWMAILTMTPMLLCAGYDEDVPGNLRSIVPVSELPAFAKEENKVEIADSFKGSDPTVVPGAIVERTNGLVHSVDSFLRNDAKTELKPVSELVVKDFVENTVIADAEWLTFVKGRGNDSARAEVTLTEVSNGVIAMSAIDRDRLQAFARSIPGNKREDYGGGYRDSVVSARTFKEQGIGGEASGYGVKIGGKWFGKHENLSADHRVIAVWSPLPFVLERVATRDTTSRDQSLAVLTHQALKDKAIHQTIRRATTAQTGSPPVTLAGRERCRAGENRRTN